MELHELDLNLLVVFNRLLAERRVSKVAEGLGVSQPAVSNSLPSCVAISATSCSCARPKAWSRRRSPTSSPSR